MSEMITKNHITPINNNAHLAEQISEQIRDEQHTTESLTSTPRAVECTHQVTESQIGMRLDKVSAIAFDGFSRSQLQHWITTGELTVNGVAQKPKYRVKVDDCLNLQTTLTEHSNAQAENIAIDIIYEDDDVVIINKAVGMVVHPAVGNWTGTLVNALLYHYPEQSHLPRAGLVHRIDKDTSGLLLIAKNNVSQLALTEQLKEKSVYRHYQCVVAGSINELQRHKVIDLPIGRHKVQRTKMSVTEGGKEAVTHLMEITELNDNYCLLDVALETGRTHQIRVHLSHIGHPLVGDKVYGQRQQLRAGLSEYQRKHIQQFPRQALHAYKLGFIHPRTGEEIQVTAPLPTDIMELIEVLRG